MVVMMTRGRDTRRPANQKDKRGLMQIKKFIGMVALMALVIGIASFGYAAERDSIIKAGEEFPAIQFPADLDANGKKYLGLDVTAKSFSIDQIDADVVVLEFFGLYCLHCRSEAPKVAKLYQMIQDEGLGDKVKFLGVGVKNSAFEVAAFRKQLKVKFPGVPDPKMENTKAVGVFATPTFIVVKKSSPATVFVTKVGDVGPLDTFVKELKEAAAK